MISRNIEVNKQAIKDLFNNTSDLILYEFQSHSKNKFLVSYINGSIDQPSLNEFLLKPLINDLKSIKDIKSSLYISTNYEIKNLENCIIPIVSGNVIMFVEGLDIAYVIGLRHWEKRQIEKPDNERVIRGPKEGFVEDIIINKTLLRRIIKNNNFVFEDFILGEQTNTTVSIAFIVGIVKPEVLKEVKEKLSKIKVDKILDGGNIEGYLDDNPKKLISTIAYSEKPDVVSSKILEGSVAIIIDGSPNVLTVPKLFIENLHAPEDYYVRPQLATFLRMLRLISFIISFTLPGIYISLILFHQEMVPSELLISIAGQREGVPLAAPLEALFMILFFELLKESGVRLPEAVGQTVTLVGGLVIGTAAVDAGIVSATMVIVVAATGMAEFVNPKLRELIPVARIIFLLLGTIAGLYGITLGLIVMTTSMVSIKSFGAPYMWPIAPFNLQGMKDTFIKVPIEKMNYRPKTIAKMDSRKRNERNE